MRNSCANCCTSCLCRALLLRALRARAHCFALLRAALPRRSARAAFRACCRFILLTRALAPALPRSNAVAVMAHMFGQKIEMKYIRLLA